MNENEIHQEHWILCPHCGAKTRVRILKDTELKCFPLFCPKCKKEHMIDAKDFIVSTVILTESNEKARR